MQIFSKLMTKNLKDIFYYRKKNNEKNDNERSMVLLKIYHLFSLSS